MDYRSRAGRIAAAVRFETPDRVPVVPTLQHYEMRYAGINGSDMMNNHAAAGDAIIKMVTELKPDAYDPLGSSGAGPFFQSMGLKNLKWAGGGLNSDMSFQYVDGEYMRPGEYSEFLADPSAFVLRRILPRVSDKFGSFADLQPMPGLIDFHSMPYGLLSFADPQVQAALKTLMRAGEAAADFASFVERVTYSLNSAGFPTIANCCAGVPFDTLTSYARGMLGAMDDLITQPEKLKEACERLLGYLIDHELKNAAWGSNPFCYVYMNYGGAAAPSGAGAFMSPGQFEEIYWPTARGLLEALIGMGRIPICHLQGDWTCRLDVIKDMPAGSVVYHFDGVDMEQAMNAIGGRFCFKGNVPLSMMCEGNPEQVTGYCRDLIVRFGNIGGLILDFAGAAENMKIDNVKAVIDAAKQ